MQIFPFFHTLVFFLSEIVIFMITRDKQIGILIPSRLSVLRQTDYFDAGCC